MAWSFFGVAIAYGVLAVAMVFFFCLIAINSTGLTSITPIGAMGKLTQLTFGALAPGNVRTNLMSASITGEVASHAANLLQDIKPGYMLGGKPRQQRQHDRRYAPKLGASHLARAGAVRRGPVACGKLLVEVRRANRIGTLIGSLAALGLRIAGCRVGSWVDSRRRCISRRRFWYHRANRHRLRRHRGRVRETAAQGDNPERGEKADPSHGGHQQPVLHMCNAITTA